MNQISTKDKKNSMGDYVKHVRRFGKKWSNKNLRKRLKEKLKKEME